MSNNKKYTLKKLENVKAKADDGKKYKIKIVETPTEEKNEWKDGETEVTITGVSIVELDKDDKETTSKNDNASATLVYKQGPLTHYFKVKEVDGKKFTDKEQKDVSTKGMIDSYRWTFWVMIAFILVLIGGLIWWWFSSSRKEDKEEEDL